MAQWCKGYLLLRRVSKGVGAFCTSVLVVLYVLCVVLCWAIAGKTSLPLFDIYRGVDSRRLRRNPRVGLPFGDKQMVIIGAGGDETKNAVSCGRGQDPSLWPIVDKQKGEIRRCKSARDQTRIRDSH